MKVNDVIEWLRSPEGEEWSRRVHHSYNMVAYQESWPCPCVPGFFTLKSATKFPLFSLPLPLPQEFA